MAGVSATSMGRKVIQVNLNHCARAQDLMVANLAQWGVDLAIVAEPYYLPHGAASSKCGSAAIICRKEEAPGLRFERLAAGTGWVAATWGDTIYVSCYLSPSWDRPAYERCLGGLRTFVVQSRNPRIFVLGDFNAKSTAWGSPGDNVRGRILGTWAEGLELQVLNRGSEPTCVRPQGSSIVDISFATPEASDTVMGWGVLDEESLSDHRYIRLTLSSPGEPPRRQLRPEGSSPRWALRRLDRNALLAAVEAVTWAKMDEGPCRDVEEEAESLRGIMTDVSDVGMPRSGGKPPPRRSVYWWSPEIENLRTQCNRARRRYTDVRRRLRGGPDTAETVGLDEEYRTMKKTLVEAIGGAKQHAWRQFLETLDLDPWGRPYRMVRKKLRTWAPPLTESMDPQFLVGVIDKLFPECPEELDRPQEQTDLVWSEEVMGVQEEELDRAVKRMGLRDTAPGPDGIHGRVWCLAYSACGPRLRRLFSACLERGVFPQIWKEARLVLLPKEGRPADSPSAYRPICLLDEAAKLFERVIANRIVEHLSGGEGLDLAESQYGFREGRSTVDAINRVRSLAEQAVTRGGVALAISFDIANAFNTLPWKVIREALREHGVPLYLRRIVGEYLRDRWVICPGKDGLSRRRVTAGVPQGSVLGPLLWNIGYNSVLRAVMPPCVSVVCYADDTLLLATGADWIRAHARAEVGARHLVSRISTLGLKVELSKTEALWFHAPRRQVPRLMTQMMVGEVPVKIGTRMKYLGLILDSTWCFEDHFDHMAPRIRGASLALSRLLPNNGGPGSAARRLYVGVVRSMALYGAPVWARDLRGSPHNRRVLLQMGRHLAQRMARAYRTVSAVSAHLLAGVPPFDLTAEMYDETYRRTREIRRGVRAGVSSVKDRLVGAMKRQAWRSLLIRWQRHLVESEDDIVRAIRPVFEGWLESCRGLTFQVTQVLTGHGCFGKYLHRIRREDAAQCRACNSAPDTAAHTLRECPAWASQRRDLRAELGGDLSLPAVVRAIVGSEEKWQALSSFCADVMSVKEERERQREEAGDPTHGPIRPRKRGRREARGPGAPPPDSSSSGPSSDVAGGGDSGDGANQRGAGPGTAPMTRARARVALFPPSLDGGRGGVDTG